MLVYYTRSSEPYLGLGGGGGRGVQRQKFPNGRLKFRIFEHKKTKFIYSILYQPYSYITDSYIMVQNISINR